MSSVNSFETDMRKLRRKRKTKRTIKNLLFIFSVILVAGIIYVTQDKWIGYLDGILERAQSNTPFGEASIASGNYPIDISKKTNTAIGTIQNGWTLFADTEFYVYDHSGDISFSVQASYSNPIITSAQKRTLIYDLGGYNFMVCSSKKQVFSKKLTDQILLGAVGEDGSVAIVTSTDKYTSYLTVYDRNGSEIFHWADGNMITAVAIDKSGKGCLVSSSYAFEGDYRSSVTMLDFSSTDIKFKTSPVKSLTFALGYCDNNSFWLLADDALYRFSLEGDVEFKYDFDFDLVSYSFSNSSCALIFENVGVNNTNISIISVDSQDVTNLTSEDNVRHLHVDGNTVYYNTDTKLFAVNSKGEPLATADLDEKYRSFAVLNDSVYLLGYRHIQRIDFVH
ncbi:MAG: hypothetical protein IJ424_05060 [Oscillospiraceae bacterium]|nr:hypothetical protein [Oscillospiraceae bacterium]